MSRLNEFLDHFGNARRWIALAFAIVITSIALLLAMPLGEQGYLAWTAMVPLFMATRGKGFAIGFISATLSIFLMAFLASSGIIYSSRSFTGNEAWIFAGCSLFGFALALTTALAADSKLQTKPVWWFAAMAVLFEAALLIQLPGHIALTQYRHGLSLGVVSIGGVWLVSYLIWFSNIAISQLTGRKQLAAIVVVTGLAIVSTGWRSRAELSDETIALIQAPTENDDLIIASHRSAAIGGAKLAVWPEFGGIMFVRGDSTAGLKELSKQLPMVTSWPDENRPMPFNVASLHAGGIESERYAKRKPFGAERQQHQAGSKAVAVPFKEMKIGLNICFDSCYPNVIRDTAQIADVIALPTIDSESPHGFLAAMHAAYTPMRSAETGVPIFRADGYAYSMATDGYGNIIAEGGLGSRVVVSAIPAPTTNRPLAFFVQDSALWVIVGAGIMGVFWWRRPKVPVAVG